MQAAERRNQLRELLARTAEIFPEYRSRTKVDSSDEAYEIVCRQVPAILDAALGQPDLKVQGSVGQGYITKAPWIAVFDPRVTTSAQSGYYVVYLYSTDLRRLYLTLAFGVTAFKALHGENQKMLAALSTAAADIRKRHPGAFERCTKAAVDLGETDASSLHTQYASASIAAFEYDCARMPSDEQLLEDLRYMVRAYDTVISQDGADIDEEVSVDQAEVQGVPTREAFVHRPPPKPSTSKVQSRTGARRSNAAKKIGDAGEKLVFDSEVELLRAAGREDLAERVQWCANLGEFPGYDIRSFTPAGEEIWIEVKSSVGTQVDTIELTENERATASSAPPGRYRIYIVSSLFKPKPRIEILVDPLQVLAAPSPVLWRFDLRGSR